MKDRIRNIVQGATLLATVLATTGYADANSRFTGRDSKFNRHTVQDAVECNPHTVQDCIKTPDNELPIKDEEVEWTYRPSIDLRLFAGETGPTGAHLALSAWSEPVEAAASSGPGFDPIALPTAELPEFSLPIRGDEPGHRFMAEATGASIPGPGAVPLLGLGALALIGRRRRA